MGHWQSKPIEDNSIIRGDMLLEILARLPVKSLVRFKSVCKCWHAAICDLHIVNLHLHLSKLKSKSREPPLLIATFPHFRQLILYSYNGGEGIVKLSLSEAIPCESVMSFRCRPVQCDGLVVMIALGRIYVYNPFTVELLPLPLQSRDSNLLYGIFFDPMVGIGFDSRAKKYKVAKCSRLFFCRGETEYTQDVEVFTLGTDNFWRLAVEQPPYPIAAVTPTCSRGAVYWTALGRDICTGVSLPKGFLRFDLLDERFSFVPGPPGSWPPDKYFHFLLTALDDEQLCFVHFGSHNTEVKMWLAKDERNPTWNHSCTISISPEQQHLSRNILPVPCALSSDGIIIVQIHETLFHCNPRTEVLNRWFDIAAEEELCNVRIPNKSPRFTVFYCPESLVPIKGHS